MRLLISRTNCRGHPRLASRDHWLLWLRGLTAVLTPLQLQPAVSNDPFLQDKPRAAAESSHAGDMEQEQFVGAAAGSLHTAPRGRASQT